MARGWASNRTRSRPGWTFKPRISGTYTVLISAQSPDANGGYQLQLAQVPESFVMPGGDEGGALADGVDQDGTIALGDLDLWTFAASPGDHITLQIHGNVGRSEFHADD